MLKKEITYVDYDGEERTETFYFNLTKTELTMMETSVDGGLSNTLKIMVSSGKVGEMIEVFKKIILSSIGQKSPDGSRFIKTDEFARDFTFSPAFDILFMELLTDPAKIAAFIKGLIPAELASKFDEELATNQLTVVSPDTV